MSTLPLSPCRNATLTRERPHPGPRLVRVELTRVKCNHAARVDLTVTPGECPLAAGDTHDLFSRLPVYNPVGIRLSRSANLHSVAQCDLSCRRTDCWRTWSTRQQ